MAFVFSGQSKAERSPDPVPDPRAQVPTKVRVLKGFIYNGRPLTIGTVVTVTAWAAADLVARGRAERVE
jgi:hypothetical protein